MFTQICQYMFSQICEGIGKILKQLPWNSKDYQGIQNILEEI